MPNTNIASFPYAAPTDAVLSVANDNAVTTLSGNINATVTTIPVTSVAGFNTPCLIVIDTEVILATNIVGGSFTECVRGFSSSTAATHVNTAPVAGYILAYHHNQIAAEVKSVGSYLFISDLSGFKESQNLMNYSETFTNSYWSTSSGSTVVTSLVTLVNGSPAYTLTEGNSLGLNMISATPSSLVTGVLYTFSVYVKYSNNQWIVIGQNLANSAIEPRLAWFDVLNGVVGNVGADANAAIVPVGNGWYRCMVVTACTANSDTAFNICLAQTNGGLGYLGASSKSVAICGAQVQSGGLTREMSYIRTSGSPFTLVNGGDLILDEGYLT